MLTADGERGASARRLVAYLVFGSWTNPQTGRLVLGNRTLAEIAGATLCTSRHWAEGSAWPSGRSFIRWVQTWLPGFAVTGWSGAAGLCREVRATGFSDALSRAVALERCTAPADRVRPVHVLSGASYARRRRDEDRTDARRRIDAQAEAAVSRFEASHLASRVLGLMNRLPQQALQRAVTPNLLRSAFELARGLDDARQRQTIAHLEAAAVTLKQPYHTVPNSARIYPDGPGLNGLATEPRDLLTANLYKVDWAKAQFAINAFLYEIQPVIDALSGAGIRWTDFTDWLGVAPTDENLSLVKRAIYALNYCAGDREIVACLTGFRPWDASRSEPTGIDHETARRLLDHPLVLATREAMHAARRRVEADGGARDAFGSWIDLGAVTALLADQPHKNPLNSVLATVAQSWELELQRPLVELLEAEEGKRDPNVRPVVWLWDGAMLQIGRKPAATLARIKSACDAHARRLGIPTTLEVG